MQFIFKTSTCFVVQALYILGIETLDDGLFETLFKSSIGSTKGLVFR